MYDGNLSPTSEGSLPAGTSGFSEEALLPADAIDVFRRGMLFTPEDPVNFRMNIGVRTLDSPATVAISVFDATGTALGTRTATYPANYFEQVPFAAFTGVATIPAGGRISAAAARTRERFSSTAR